MTTTKYPLCWPVGWPRTAPALVSASRYSKKSMKRVTDDLLEEVRLLGGSGLVISSNVQLRQNGLPKSGQKQPGDRGASIYFNRSGKQLCFACDKWGLVEDNLWAIKLTIEALRQLERAGVSDMLDRAFTGFLALPAPALGATWYEVLGVPQTADRREIDKAYRELAKLYHPDTGGSHDEFIKIQRAYNEAKSGK